MKKYATGVTLSAIGLALACSCGVAALGPVGAAHADASSTYQVSGTVQVSQTQSSSSTSTSYSSSTYSYSSGSTYEISGTVQVSPSGSYWTPAAPASDWSYVIPGSDSRLLSDDDVRWLGSYGLYLARNEIYARHGYVFTNSDLQAFFGSKAWYVPRYTSEQFSDAWLSYTEQRNIALILKWEEAWDNGTAQQDTSYDWSYVIPGSDSRLLTDNDVRYLNPYTLYLARNEIYARHGYIFENSDLASFFGSKAWYRPLYTAAAFDEGVLSYTEQRNIGLIIKWEEAWEEARR